jgi:hypothetical protein
MEIVDAVDGGALVVAPWQEVAHLQDAQNVNSGGRGSVMVCGRCGWPLTVASGRR